MNSTRLRILLNAASYGSTSTACPSPRSGQSHTTVPPNAR